MPSSQLISRNRAEQARLLAGEGLTDEQIAERMNVTVSAVSRWLTGPPAKAAAVKLNRDAWLSFLRSHLDDDLSGSVVGGRQLSDAHVRALFRWQHEGAAPGLWAADEFCVAVGLHLDEFFGHCDARNLQPWACGAAPAWHHAMT
jgi:transcriptional regulator with XRE-family HTH domain